MLALEQMRSCDFSLKSKPLIGSTTFSPRAMGLHEPLSKRDQDKSKAPQALEKVSKCHTISHKDIRIMLANHR
jgi:hypothetical protein